MTIMDALYRVDEVKPNTFSQTEKIHWLNTLDGMIKSKIIDTHEGGEDITFEGYTSDVGINTVLLVPAPYDDIYIRYLEMQIDYANGEYGKYNNSMAVYNTAYSAFEKHYNRTHKPISKNYTHF